MDRDDKKRERKNRLRVNEVRFTKEVDPTAILPYFKDLPKSQKERIKCTQRNMGPIQAAQDLAGILVKYDDWFDPLMLALKDNNQKELHDLLADPCEESLPSMGGKVQEHHASTPLVANVIDPAITAVNEVVTARTLYNKLPGSVLPILKKLDVISNVGGKDWQDLAYEFGFNIGSIKLMKNSVSPTDALLDEWSKRENATLGLLMVTLREIHRIDIYQELIHKLGLRPAPNSRMPQNAVNRASPPPTSGAVPHNDESTKSLTEGEAAFAVHHGVATPRNIPLVPVVGDSSESISINGKVSNLPHDGNENARMCGKITNGVNNSTAAICTLGNNLNKNRDPLSPELNCTGQTLVAPIPNESSSSNTQVGHGSFDQLELGLQDKIYSLRTDDSLDTDLSLQISQSPGSTLSGRQVADSASTASSNQSTTTSVALSSSCTTPTAGQNDEAPLQFPTSETGPTPPCSQADKNPPANKAAMVTSSDASHSLLPDACLIHSADATFEETVTLVEEKLKGTQRDPSLQLSYKTLFPVQASPSVDNQPDSKPAPSDTQPAPSDTQPAPSDTPPAPSDTQPGLIYRKPSHETAVVQAPPSVDSQPGTQSNEYSDSDLHSQYDSGTDPPSAKQSETHPAITESTIKGIHFSSCVNEAPGGLEAGIDIESMSNRSSLSCAPDEAGERQPHSYNSQPPSGADPQGNEEEDRAPIEAPRQPSGRLIAVFAVMFVLVAAAWKALE